MLRELFVSSGAGSCYLLSERVSSVQRVSMLADAPLEISIPRSRFKVFGRFQGKKSQPLIIMIHGLTGNMDEYFYRMGCEFFAKCGFATYRLNLYSFPKGARRIVDTTLRIHADDLNVVVRYFRRKGFKKIFAVGHSYGGATILLSDPDKLDGAVLWDPTHGATFTKRKWGGSPARYLKQIDAYLVDWGVYYVLGRAMVEEADDLEWDKLAAKFSAPTRIVCAGSGVLTKGCEHYFKTLPAAKKDLKVIRNATHYFSDRPGMEDRVYRLTCDWFKKLS